MVDLTQPSIRQVSVWSESGGWINICLTDLFAFNAHPNVYLPMGMCMTLHIRKLYSRNQLCKSEARFILQP